MTCTSSARHVCLAVFTGHLTDWPSLQKLVNSRVQGLSQWLQDALQEVLPTLASLKVLRPKWWEKNEKGSILDQ